MVDPVSGFGDIDQLVTCNGSYVALLLRIVRPAVQASKQQSRAGYLPPQLLRVLHIKAVRRDRADIIVEFPYQGSVGIPVGTEKGQMPRHLIREIRIGLLHARDSGLEIGVPACGARFELPDVLN